MIIIILTHFYNFSEMNEIKDLETELKKICVLSVFGAHPS